MFIIIELTSIDKNDNISFNIYIKQTFFNSFLIYLNMINFLRLENSEELTDRALNLLNAKGDELDPSLVLSIVPENWSVSMLSSFLHASLRSSMHKVIVYKHSQIC